MDLPPHAVAVLLKRVDLRPTVDPLTGELHHDPHGGLSPADECALELALRTAEATGSSVLAATAGGAESDAVLHQALAAGAGSAVRVEIAPGATSAEVAGALSEVVAGCRWIWCGDHSLDRGSGSVPAFVAAALSASQALGVAAVDLTGVGAGEGPPGGLRKGDPGGLRVERRLDGGRREVLEVTAPAVVSVESGVAAPRRSSLAGVLAARAAVVRVVSGPRTPAPPEERTRPYRPRARLLRGPDPGLSPRERMVILSGALVQREPPRVVHADAGQAVDELLAFLGSRGYDRPVEPEPGEPFEPEPGKLVEP